ncbi:MAG: hypothetical protein JO250_06690 [Armatimonadetes bacterium]|nr:hypothetical protein [Armatimonadota bacterium]
MRHNKTVWSALALVGGAAILGVLSIPARTQAPGGPPPPFPGGPMPGRPPVAFGTVSAVDAGAATLTLTTPDGGSQKVSVASDAQIVTQKTIGVADLQVGDQVQVRGVPTGITASAITDGQPPKMGPPPGFGPGGPGRMPPPGGPGGRPGTFAVATGKVTAASPLTITISDGVTLTVQTATDAKITEFTPLKLGDVKVGDRVAASGQTDASGALTATQVGVNLAPGPGMPPGPGGRG